MVTFAQPLFLLGGLALAVPVVLHLLRRQVAVNVVFPSIRFILKGRLPKTGRRRLRDILLLMLRLALFALIVLAFARPRWQSQAPAAAEKARPGAVIFVVDASASMAGWGSFQHARARVDRWLQERPRISAGLVVSTDKVISSVSPTRDHDAVRAALEASRASPLEGRHGPALRRAIAMLPEERPSQIVILSDFQAFGWGPADMPQLPPDVRLDLIDVNPEPDANAGIVSARVRRLPADTVQVRAAVRNFHHAPLDRTITLDAGDSIRTKDVRLPPARQTVVTLTVKDPSARGVLSLDSDSYGYDDNYHVWLGDVPPVKLLAVVPFEAEPEKQNELFFVRKALGVRTEYATRAYTVETVDAEFFFALDLSSVDGVLLLGAAGHFQEPGFEKLADYVRGGGTAFCTPGRNAGQQFLGLRRHRLFTAEFNGITGSHATAEGFVGIASVAEDSLLARVFVEPDESDLFLFPIRRHARLQLHPPARAILTADTGTPILARQDSGRGALYVCAVELSPEWSDWPMTTSFLPVLREPFAPEHLSRSAGILETVCGNALRLPGRLTGESADSVDNVDTDKPGSGVAGEYPYQINVSRRESLTNKQSLVALRAHLAGSADSARAGNAGVAAGTAPPPIDLWPWCAAIAAAFLIGEMLFAASLEKRDLGGAIPPSQEGTAAS